ncbi:MAG: class I SAM-dependent methyltransferase [Candidatus Methanomethylophilaceae archaeon]|nr:class I SAM-dependent methyltransferase [Candidatus Methanomethylophilaceae archaeon]
MEQRDLWDGFYRQNPRAWRGTSSIPVPCEGKALDVGCGNGKTVSALMEAGLEVTGVDFSPTVIGRCKEAYPDATFIECDASALPFQDETFDYVVAVHVMENLDDAKLFSAASEMRRVLRTGGYLLVRCFTPDDMRSGERRGGFFYRYFELEDVLDLFEGLETVESFRKDEPTSFGTVRSRVECLFRKK